MTDERVENASRITDSHSFEFFREYPKTGPDTAGGKMLRHYWHPVCLSRDLIDIPYPVRILSEDLVAYRGKDGKAAVLGRRCPHRCAALEYGQIRAKGLQCSYHGWTFDAQGHCVDMPLEPENSPLKQEIRHLWYPVQEWGGIIWVYMGPDKETPPPLPMIDILSRTDGEVVLERGDIRNYSYLNFLENFADMGHVYVLHLLQPGTVPEELLAHVDMSVDTQWHNIEHRNFETKFGMKSVLVHNTSKPDVKYINTWSLALPTFYRFGGIAAGLPPDFTVDRRESGGVLRIIDDGHFELFRFQLVRPGNFRCSFYPRRDTERGLATGMSGTVEKKAYDYRQYPAWEGIPPLEDLVIQESQGVTPPYHMEHLATSDTGVALLRRIWRKSLSSVVSGGMPKLVQTDDGIIETDTFKGFAKVGEFKLGPDNLPSSRNGEGLIRDHQGNLVFA